MTRDGSRGRGRGRCDALFDQDNVIGFEQFIRDSRNARIRRGRRGRKGSITDKERDRMKVRDAVKDDPSEDTKDKGSNPNDGITSTIDP